MPLLLLLALVFVSALQEPVKVRTVNEQQCNMPFTYQNEVHHECLFSQEFKKTWCFTDTQLTQWNFCAQEESPQKKQFLLKNLQEDMKTNLCLSAEDKSLKAIDCATLIKTWRRLIWNWQSPGLILFQATNQHICIRSGKVKLCESGDKEGDEFYLDDTGKVMNTLSSECLVLVSEEIHCERCLDKQFQGREIFQLNEFNEKQLENYELQAEIEEWKSGHSLLKSVIQTNKQLKSTLNTCQERKDLIWAQLAKQKDQLGQLDTELQQSPKGPQGRKAKKSVQVEYYDDIAFSQKKCGFSMESLVLTQESLREQAETLQSSGECGQMGQSQLGIRMESVLMPEETGRYRLKALWQGGGLRLQVDNKMVIDKWSVGENKESTAEDLVLFQGQGYQLSLEYFSIDPVETMVRIESLLVDESTNTQTYSQMDSRLLVSSDQFRCEPVLLVDFQLQSPLAYQRLYKAPENTFSILCQDNSPIENLSENQNLCRQLINLGYLGTRGGVANVRKYKNTNITKYKHDTHSYLHNTHYIHQLQIMPPTSPPNSAETFILDDTQAYQMFYTKTYDILLPHLTDVQLSCQEYDDVESVFSTYRQLTQSGYKVYYQMSQPGKSGNYIQEVYLKSIKLNAFQEEQENPLLEQPDGFIEQGWDRQSCFDQVEFQQLVLYVKRAHSKMDEQLHFPDIVLNCSSSWESLNSTVPQVVSCPANCQVPSTPLKGMNVYSSSSPVCHAAVYQGLIGYALNTHILQVNPLVLSNTGIQTQTLNNLTSSPVSPSDSALPFFYLSSVAGRACAYYPSSLSHLNLNHSSFLQLDTKLGTTLQDNLNMIPTELISKLANVMNQNTQNIIQQNMNINELSQENQNLQDKITLIDNQQIPMIDNKLSSISSAIKQMQSALQASRNKATADEQQQKNKEQQARQEVLTRKSKSIESTGYKEKSFERQAYQVIDSLKGKLPCSRWAFSPMKDSPAVMALQQSQAFNYDFNSGPSHQSLFLLHRRLASDYLFSLSFLVSDFVVFSLVLHYQDPANYIELLLEQTYRQKQLRLIKYSQGHPSILSKVTLCNFQAASLPNDPHCLTVKMNTWTSVDLVHSREQMHILVEQQKVFNHTVPSPQLSRVGFSSVLGSAVYFRDIQLQTFSLDHLIQPKIHDIIQTPKASTNKAVPAKSKSIELIKEKCMAQGGSGVSCTAAMIAYDQYVTEHKGVSWEREDLQSRVFEKCIKMRESKTLACQVAYETALEVSDII